MSRPFIFFDLGQTLIDEWDFIDHFDTRFLETLNGFGARIDQRNYRAVRDSVIRDRKIGHCSAEELVKVVCRLLAPSGYEKMILEKLSPEIRKGRKELFRFSDDADEVLSALRGLKCDMGLIANQAEDVLELVEKSGFGDFFKVRAISSLVKLEKPDPRIFELAMNEAGRKATECIMVGDRLDTDICPAHRLGMTTIRTTNSLFSLQQPRSECEHATYTVARLSEITGIVEDII
ncbi:MAG: HAD family hydrolase [Nitrososphaera sp.]